MADVKRRLGVHTSIAGGIHLSLERARELGCSTIQIFSHNPRQWLANEIPAGASAQFRELRRTYGIDPVYIHASYLINLASLDSAILERSIQLLARELDLADLLAADYVVLHTGSASQDNARDARRRAVGALRVVAGTKAWKAKLLLENTAGERGDISSRMEDLSEIIRETESALIAGVCIDSCHAFAAGYDLSREQGPAQLADEVERYLKADSVKLIHLNDSKKGCNSHVDRHEHIGQGSIGIEGLKRFVNHPVFRNIPLVLETPKKSEEDDPRNIKAVREFLGE